jgi:glycosyltransferase involved in cell wall biosynthesis
MLGQIKSLYVNEGGHVRYIKLLARLFPKVRFRLHIRILEDTRAERLQTSLSNVKVFAISHFIAEAITNRIQNVSIIYDPYKLINGLASPSFDGMRSESIHIGTIGRVTPSKGLKEIVSFCNYLESLEISNITMHFFGDIEMAHEDVRHFYGDTDRYAFLKVKFHGFTESKQSMYKHIDILIHFNRHEPLGRIFFEALDFGIPVLGFDSGGIGEIARLLGLQKQMVKANAEWQREMLDKVLSLTSTTEGSGEYAAARRELAKQFCAKKYCERLESYIL